MRHPNFFIQPAVSFKKNNHLYYCLQILATTEVRGFRTLFGKPVNGQKTSQNAKTSSNQPSLLYVFKYRTLSTFNPSLTKPIFVAEYTNLFWQHQWVFEWVSSFQKLKVLPLYIKKTNFIDIQSMNRFLIYHHYSNPFKKVKKMSQKRKKVIPKNKYSTGFPFGFSIVFKRQLTIL